MLGYTFIHNPTRTEKKSSWETENEVLLEIKSNRLTEKEDTEKVPDLKIYLMFIGLNEVDLGKVKIFSLR